MIPLFSLYPRLLVKFGEDERHIFDQRNLMFTEAAEVEKITGASYAEWGRQLDEYSITALAALLHILRKREGMASDFASMQFPVADLDVVPLHEDDREFTPQDLLADLAKRAEDAAGGNGAGPTSATDGAVAPGSSPITKTSTPGSSPNGSASAPGSGTGSPGVISAGASPTSTPS